MSLTPEQRKRAHQIQAAQADLQDKLDRLVAKLDALRQLCDHRDMPKREPYEEHCDTCPDCGYVSYLYGRLDDKA